MIVCRAVVVSATPAICFVANGTSNMKACNTWNAIDGQVQLTRQVFLGVAGTIFAKCE